MYDKEQIISFIENDAELLHLFRTDPLFHTAISQVIHTDVDMVEAFIAIIKDLCDSNKNIFDNYLEHMRTCPGPRVIFSDR